MANTDDTVTAKIRPAAALTARERLLLIALHRDGAVGMGPLSVMEHDSDIAKILAAKGLLVMAKDDPTLPGLTWVVLTAAGLVAARRLGGAS